MASRAISDLVPEMRSLANQVVELCAESGVNLLIYTTLRTLEEQAKLYRRSRSTSQIQWKINQLNNKGFDFLAEVLDGVGPQPSGSQVTKAGPGESWHNYGRAFDAVPLVNGQAAWSVSRFKDLWQIYGNSAESVGLEWGGNWTSFKDYPHSQFASGANPVRSHDPQTVKRLLQEAGLL